jgi:hypothetical protein
MSINVDAIVAQYLGIGVNPMEAVIANVIDGNSKSKGVETVADAGDRVFDKSVARGEKLASLPANHPLLKLNEDWVTGSLKDLATVRGTIANRPAPRTAGLL